MLDPSKIRRWFRIRLGPPKWLALEKAFGSSPFKILEVGCGNHVASETIRNFPHAEYHGLDISRSYNNDQEDFVLMKAFYEVDLTTLDYGIVPDAFFDVIIMAHVLEHLPNGLEALSKLGQKVKANGLFYIEWPHPRSVAFPSMRSSLNFYDDPTHVRLYTMVEVCNTLHSSGFKPLIGRTRKSYWHRLFSPALIARNVFRNRGLIGPDVWDWVGFAQFVIARRLAG
jgi:SAM-dependent methyltransferase